MQTSANDSPAEDEDVLENVIGRQLMGAAVSTEYGLLALCFEEGKTLFVRGKFDIDLEAAN